MQHEPQVHSFDARAIVLRVCELSIWLASSEALSALEHLASAERRFIRNYIPIYGKN